MGAITVQLRKMMRSQMHSWRFFEMFLRVMITLSTGTAVVLSSISICDGNWLLAPGQPLFAVWDTCRASRNPPCSEEMVQLSRCMVVVRSAVSLGVVMAIFGLELLMVSQLCDDGKPMKRWKVGSVMLLVAFFMSSVGTLTYVILLKDFIVYSTFTLTFWCQFLATFLFFLNGVSGLYLNHLVM
ncbi:voltage-dependent calcium channel gamma-like subunit [Hyperolius riggenbachi]|uniref:voltage-dependent calcium channel gamma-like subunit n=1 Tax=Hyperolius riggenbachi TaxID=752182 RepID=UPI0035A2ABCC